ncbi:UNVERIFIED_CONTAM: hypothetical protein Sradi_2280700 [Sesamum radiatum]|uniref:Uncharacterized protein n=1 Tax=Sesamum radiatum TaxID=300843 RepID=A0AAW2T3T7_SESRA
MMAESLRAAESSAQGDAEPPYYAHSQGTAMNGGYDGGMSRASGGGGGGGGGGMGGSGGYGPRYPPPAASGGGGGGWGWGWDSGSGSCGGGATPPCGGGCGPSPQPVTCPIGCQPAVHWAYNWPIHAMNYMDHMQSQSAHMYPHGPSSQSKVDMHEAEAHTSVGGTMQNELSETERQDSEPKPVDPSGKGL